MKPLDTRTRPLSLNEGEGPPAKPLAPGGGEGAGRRGGGVLLVPALLYVAPPLGAPAWT